MSRLNRLQWSGYSYDCITAVQEYHGNLLNGDDDKISSYSIFSRRGFVQHLIKLDVSFFFYQTIKIRAQVECLKINNTVEK